MLNQKHYTQAYKESSKRNSKILSPLIPDSSSFTILQQNYLVSTPDETTVLIALFEFDNIVLIFSVRINLQQSELLPKWQARNKKLNKI